jgi:hypothetical protein
MVLQHWTSEISAIFQHTAQDPKTYLRQEGYYIEGDYKTIKCYPTLWQDIVRALCYGRLVQVTVVVQVPVLDCI